MKDPSASVTRIGACRAASPFFDFAEALVSESPIPFAPDAGHGGSSKPEPCSYPKPEVLAHFDH